MISGLFSGGLYLLPIFSGAYADKIGFRKSMIIAFSLLSIGYLGLGVLPTLLETAGLVNYGATTRSLTVCQIAIPVDYCSCLIYTYGREVLL